MSFLYLHRKNEKEKLIIILALKNKPKNVIENKKIVAKTATCSQFLQEKEDMLGEWFRKVNERGVRESKSSNTIRVFALS